VVIAIIGVLIGLILPAVFKVLDPAYEARARTEITQLSSAVLAFQQKYSVSYLPSRLLLCKDYLNYFNGRNPGQGFVTPLHQDSMQYLLMVFPRIGSGDGAHSLPSWAIPNPNPDPNYYTGIDWNQTGLPDQSISLSVHPLPNPVPCLGDMLEGEQCLVFFLGGIPGSGAMNGFSTNPRNPAAGTDRVPPFFDFKSNRLVVFPGTAPGYPSYLDAFGKSPYAYFSSYKTANGYNRYVYIANPYLPLVPGSPITTDCQALNAWPYALSLGSAPVYYNAQTYQIISAGKNFNFGSGTVVSAYPGFPGGNQAWAGAPFWSPATAAALFPRGSDGYDDITNFYDRLLGVATQ
jgi:hypothetical protein